MTERENIAELELKLAVAVVQQDLLAGMEALEMLACYSHHWSEALIAARRLANPPAPLAPVEPFKLPVPGVLAGSTLGCPIVA